MQLHLEAEQEPEATIVEAALPATALPVDKTKSFRETWLRAIDRLRLERMSILRRRQTAKGREDHEASLRLMRIGHEIAMFEICIDRVNERQENQELRRPSELDVRRAKYYQLMASLAHAQHEHAERSTTLQVTIVDDDAEEAWTSGRWIEELESAATDVRRSLVDTCRGFNA